MGTKESKNTVSILWALVDLFFVLLFWKSRFTDKMANLAFWLCTVAFFCNLVVIGLNMKLDLAWVLLLAPVLVIGLWVCVTPSGTPQHNIMMRLVAEKEKTR